ncbi:hypothetical protein IV02_08275 [Pseudomonas syringae]|uniref:Uncharacterized protein n=1 Tax=Pseudomonas syringae TaxID=317 RepID=A0A085VAF6_PSESX|nr:hypothetical protein IV02_08275 [Pseudomonas syringae]
MANYNRQAHTPSESILYRCGKSWFTKVHRPDQARGSFHAPQIPARQKASPVQYPNDLRFWSLGVVQEQHADRAYQSAALISVKTFWDYWELAQNLLKLMPRVKAILARYALRLVLENLVRHIYRLRY